MHDFNCTDAADMNYNIMAERTRYLKENQKGVNEMCKAMEEMRNEVVDREKKESALRMKAMGLSDEVIAKAVDVSLTIIKQWIGITTA
jgi:ATP/maltotriose-dependent transcriptional regulator MalT